MRMSDGTRVILDLLEEYRGLRKLNLNKQPTPLMSNVPKRQMPHDPIQDWYKRHGIRIS